MTCENCGSDKATRQSTYFLGNGKKVVNCEYCPDKYSPTPLVGKGVQYTSIHHEGKPRTMAHDMDISRRRLAPDGSVYRDYKSKSFVVSGFK